MTDEERGFHVAALLDAISGGVWPLMQRELTYQREWLVESLVTQNSDEIRGKIKLIDDLLRLPNTLRRELPDPLPE